MAATDERSILSRDVYSASVDDSDCVTKVTNAVYEIIINHEKFGKPIMIVCVGTDRSTGDCLGPMVGTLLSENSDIDNLASFRGTLDNPIHAKNLASVMSAIDKSKYFVIAIDASLGKKENIGKVNVFSNGLSPGSGVGKDLGEIGDISITGIVNIGGFMEYIILQNTRLSLVTKIAKAIEQSLYGALMRASSRSVDIYSIEKVLEVV